MGAVWFLGGLVLMVVGLVLSVGAMLSRDHVATGSIVVPVPAFQVWRDIRDISALPTWRKSVSKVETTQGPPTAPTSWVEHSGGDALALRIQRVDEPKSIETVIDNEKLPFGGTWTIELTPEGAGTRVRVTERGIIKPPPFRFIARFFIGYSATLRGYLSDLGAKHGVRTPVEP